MERSEDDEEDDDYDEEEAEPQLRVNRYTGLEGDIIDGARKQGRFE